VPSPCGFGRHRGIRGVGFGWLGFQPSQPKPPCGMQPDSASNGALWNFSNSL